MSKFLFTIFIAALPFFQTAIENPTLEVSHDIESVTVYLNSAEIYRKAKATIPAGKTDLIFRGISNRTMTQGMKINISNNVKVYAVTSETDETPIEDDPAWQALKEESKVFYNKVKANKIVIEVLENELLYMKENFKRGGNNGASFTELDEAADYFRKKMTDLEIKLYDARKEQLENSIEERQYEEQFFKLKKDLEKINRIIRITVISESEVTSEIDLRYLVSNAVWSPYYSLRAKGKDEPIVIEYQAQIYNDTGNDWDNKPLTLAIMNSSDDVSKPLLDAWVLDNKHRSNKEGNLSNKKGKRFSSSTLRDSEYDKKADDIFYDVLRIDDLSTRFEIEDLHLIPSDASPHLIDVTTYTKQASFYNLSIPKVKNGAFLIAQIPDWESLGLLDGPMNLYYNDAFQGISTLNTQQVSDTLEVSLGKENSFTVTRRKLSNKSSEKIIGLNIKEVLTYEIIVKNNKSQAAEIEVRDQLPVSNNKNVEVKALDISGAQVDLLSGQLSWKVKLAANENKKIIVQFSVKYPKSKRGILRLNRQAIATPRYF